MAKNITVQGIKFTTTQAKAFRSMRLLNAGHINSENVSRSAGISKGSATHAITCFLLSGLIEWVGTKPGESAYALTTKGAEFPAVPTN